jgi:hydrogenase maturation protease
MHKYTLVMGVGNILLSDEGAGIHTVRHLQQNRPAWPGVRFLDAGTLGFTLAADIAEASDLIVVDAARLGSGPGSIRTFVGEEFDRFIRKGKLSAHEVGMADLIDIARLSGHLPERRALVGVEPEQIDWGDEPGPSVSRAIPLAADAVTDLLRRWQVIPAEDNPS